MGRARVSGVQLDNMEDFAREILLMSKNRGAGGVGGIWMAPPPTPPSNRGVEWGGSGRPHPTSADIFFFINRTLSDNITSLSHALVTNEANPNRTSSDIAWEGQIQIGPGSTIYGKISALHIIS